VLLKSVMSLLPVYALSFFKAPSGIISTIESIFILFFEGRRDDHRKILWVEWKTVCRSKEVGGLGVRSIMEFNLALLGRWCWRFLVDRSSLWFRVLASQYGVAGWRIQEGGRTASAWWRDLYALCREGWFNDNVSRSLGNGKHTLFWSDVWLDGMSFSVRFSRLYELSMSKKATVFWHESIGLGR